MAPPRHRPSNRSPESRRRNQIPARSRLPSRCQRWRCPRCPSFPTHSASAKSERPIPLPRVVHQGCSGPCSVRSSKDLVHARLAHSPPHIRRGLCSCTPRRALSRKTVRVRARCGCFGCIRGACRVSISSRRLDFAFVGYSMYSVRVIGYLVTLRGRVFLLCSNAEFPAALVTSPPRGRAPDDTTHEPDRRAQQAARRADRKAARPHQPRAVYRHRAAAFVGPGGRGALLARGPA